MSKSSFASFLFAFWLFYFFIFNFKQLIIWNIMSYLIINNRWSFIKFWYLRVPHNLSCLRIKSILFLKNSAVWARCLLMAIGGIWIFIESLIVLLFFFFILVQSLVRNLMGWIPCKCKCNCIFTSKFLTAILSHTFTIFIIRIHI